MCGLKDSSSTTIRTNSVRVCFVIDELAVAGVEGQLLLLLERLDRARIQPLLCMLKGHDALSRSLEPKNCPVITLGVRSLHGPASFRSVFRLYRFLRREHIEIVHALCPDSLYFAAPVARLAGVPCVVRFCVNMGYWMNPLDRWLGKIYTRLVDATVANCEACRQAVIADQGTPPESVVIIPNGVDLSRFNGRGLSQFSRSENGTVPLPTALQRVGIVANLRPVKNLELFIRAAGRLVPSHPNVQFEIAGEGDLHGRLEGLIESLGLRDHVKLLGSVSDIPAFLSSLNVAVLCSHSEGSPNAIMEYMAAGLPSVVTDVGGNRELIEHERYGLVVAPNDLEQLSAAIARLLDDRPLASRLGKNARQRAFAEFGVETQARRYEQFYQELFQRKVDTAHFWSHVGRKK